MSCPQKRDTLHAYLDEELDSSRRAAYEEHLRACADCSRELATQQTLRAGLRDDSFRRAAPAGLKERIRAALRPAAPALQPPRRLAPSWFTAAAALLIGVAAGAAAMYLATTRKPAPDADLPRDLVAAHVRSLMADHLQDVKSSDRHTVKPWFRGQLDFSPPVKDFAEQGYPLEGGRLDYIDDRPAAALVYGRAKHVINLFIWPAADVAADAPVRATARRGFNLLHWTRGGLQFWAVSDLNAEELGEFARLQIEGGP